MGLGPDIVHVQPQLTLSTYRPTVSALRANGILRRRQGIFQTQRQRAPAAGFRHVRTELTASTRAMPRGAARHPGVPGGSRSALSWSRTATSRCSITRGCGAPTASRTVSRFCWSTRPARSTRTSTLTSWREVVRQLPSEVAREAGRDGLHDLSAGRSKRFDSDDVARHETTH